MGELTTRTLVRCPVSEAAGRVASYLERRAELDSDSHQLRFAYVLPPEHTQLADRIVVSFTRATTRVSQWLYAVRWTAGDPDVEPPFSGYLRIEPHADYNAFSLCLTGDFVTAALPLRPALSARHRLAKEANATLLASLAHDIEHGYRCDERAKISAGSSVETASQVRP